VKTKRVYNEINVPYRPCAQCEKLINGREVEVRHHGVARFIHAACSGDWNRRVRKEQARGVMPASAASFRNR
jgi:hypothetical protein